MEAGIYVKNWRNRKKLELILYKGGKCEVCGYDNIECPRAFDFHHKDPTQKEFSISGKSWRFEVLKTEVDKCQLLCCRCHAEIHNDLDRQKREERLKISKRTKVACVKICPQCSEEFFTKDERRKHCSEKCAQLNHRKVNRPSKEELGILLQSHVYCKIGRMFGVSDNAVRKWAKSYTLFPRRP